MTNVMTKFYLSSYFKIENLKGKLDKAISKLPDTYNVWWVVLAIVTIVVVAVAHNTCVRSGYRAFGGSWKATATSGRFNVGCIR